MQRWPVGQNGGVAEGKGKFEVTVFNNSILGELA